MIRIVQIACIAVTALILFGFREILRVSADAFGSGFAPGFLGGVAFCAILYGVICWIDPASRPRGTAKQQSFRDGID